MRRGRQFGELLGGIAKRPGQFQQVFRDPVRVLHQLLDVLVLDVLGALVTDASGHGLVGQAFRGHQLFDEGTYLHASNLAGLHRK